MNLSTTLWPIILSQTWLYCPAHTISEYTNQVCVFCPYLDFFFRLLSLTYSFFLPFDLKSEVSRQENGQSELILVDLSINQ